MSNKKPMSNPRRLLVAVVVVALICLAIGISLAFKDGSGSDEAPPQAPREALALFRMLSPTVLCPAVEMSVDAADGTNVAIPGGQPLAVFGTHEAGCEAFALTIFAGSVVSVREIVLHAECTGPALTWDPMEPVTTCPTGPVIVDGILFRSAHGADVQVMLALEVGEERIAAGWDAGGSAVAFPEANGARC